SRMASASAWPVDSPSWQEAEFPSCKSSHSRAIPCCRHSFKTPINLAFSSLKSSSGLTRLSMVNQQVSGTTLKFVPPPLCPPSMRMELRGRHEFQRGAGNLLVHH